MNNLIDTVMGASEDNNYHNIGIDKFFDKANTITYTFKLDINGNYYFYSSQVEK